VKVSIIVVAFVSVSNGPITPMILSVTETVLSPVPMSVVPIGWTERERGTVKPRATHHFRRTWSVIATRNIQGIRNVPERLALH
jgi:hypothetical protein